MAERLAALTKLADPSAPAINLVGDPHPRGENGVRRRGPARTLLYDVARGMARRVPLTKLVELDADVRPYLASLMVAAMDKAGDELLIPHDMVFRPIARAQWEAMLAAKAGEAYHQYGALS